MGILFIEKTPIANEDPIQHNFEKIFKIIYSDKNNTKLNIFTSLGHFYTRAPKPMTIKTKRL